MYFIWQYPSKQIKVVNSLINVKVDRKFSLYKYIQDRQKFPLFLSFFRKSCQDSLKIIFNWHLSDEPEIPWSWLSTNQMIRNKALLCFMNKIFEEHSLVDWKLLGWLIHNDNTITFREYQKYQFLDHIMSFDSHNASFMMFR